MSDRIIKRVFVILLIAGVMACRPQPIRAAVIVRLEPSSPTVNLGDSFDVQIKADIGEPVVGWGLDLAFDHAVLSTSAPPSLGPLWLSAGAADGDGLVGLAFPSDVSGNGALLATLHFQATAIGETDLVPSATSGDLTEGFPLYPTGFATATFQPGHVTVVPEPGALVLLVGAALVWGGRKRR